jgi:tetratricopeptide (TPR) repeat protein
MKCCPWHHWQTRRQHTHARLLVTVVSPRPRQHIPFFVEEGRRQMDARDATQDVLERAVKEINAGNYRAGVELLRPLLQPKRKQKLSPQQEHEAVSCLGVCYRALLDFKAALPYAQRLVVLAQQLLGPRSVGHAQALKGLCMVHQGLKAFPPARKAISEALAVMEELGLQQHEQYGSMLRALGGLDLEQGQYKEALVIFYKAKVVLVQHKEGNEYGALLNEMGDCHKELHQWSEAVACYKEAVEHSRNLHGNNHPNYATALYNLAFLFARLKQYEEAIPRMEEALAIRQRVYGDQHDLTVQTAKRLAEVRQLASQSDRDAIDVGHNFRMCSLCGAVSEIIFTCPCDRAWYCNADCQLQHWPTHKPQCSVCFCCSTLLTKVKRCSRCQIAKYCNAACQTAHWSEHKKDCSSNP